MLFKILAFGIILLDLNLAQNPCQSRDFGNGGTVCVCNATYCDTTPRPPPQPPTQFLLYTSNKAGLRFQQTSGVFIPLNATIRILTTSPTGEIIEVDGNPKNEIFIDSTISYQRILGFGGAFTDSTGINILSLPEAAQDLIIESLFGPDGLEYNLGRVPIGSTDFSTHPYTYDDGPEDPELNNFKLAPEDHKYKIPIILKAINSTNNNLRLLSSAWTAPKWMKTNDAYVGFGFIRRSMYQSWANYFVKFLDLYQKQNITFWGITTGNEPANILYPFGPVEDVGWPSWLIGDWISHNLGPTIRNSNHSDIMIMILDDQRIFLPWYLERVFRYNSNSKKFIDGIAVHWYLDQYVPASVLTRTHQLYPDKFLLGTEACIVPKGGESAVLLGSWRRGEDYSYDIIQDLQHWVTGWVDWNMVLNLDGGPTYINNFVDAAIIVNSTSEEFFKQPLYYHMGHFSKFLPRGSTRIFATPNKGRSVQIVAFQRPDNSTAVVLINRRNSPVFLNVTDLSHGTASLELTPRSITTLLYW